MWCLTLGIESVVEAEMEVYTSLPGLSHSSGQRQKVLSLLPSPLKAERPSSRKTKWSGSEPSKKKTSDIRKMVPVGVWVPEHVCEPGSRENKGQDEPELQPLGTPGAAVLGLLTRKPDNKHTLQFCPNVWFSNPLILCFVEKFIIKWYEFDLNHQPLFFFFKSVSCFLLLTISPFWSYWKKSLYWIFTKKLLIYNENRWISVLLIYF